MTHFDPVTLALVLAMLALLPTVAVVTTSFLKISIVMSLVRNALGVQQAPPNIALYGMALILTAYIMAPVGLRAYDGMMAVSAASPAGVSGASPAGVSGASPAGVSRYPDVAGAANAASPLRIDALFQGLKAGIEPLKDFMLRNSRPEQRVFFANTARRIWGAQLAAGIDERTLLVLVPAFVLSEMNAAFQIGFLLYLPFVLIDLIVSNVLLAMGMMMVSPVTISLPLKLFLFVMVDGWTRLIQGLVLSYIQ
ncbi:EscR/YscR/HrcR family type III secretion system export apparatus protein [Robbsia sp. Bb-Pol-6]|uniref:EscR/YscR/HrcR family type III secretion system export apparatus protein n=1 Tax=Robbsia betulipollinis TaxID=2981849 RepID=A0ABT3ZL95_9BURK|nr:EscR/YscR/HrcR family type III secretion system export apparatus protein [Robbsia betulipollinis]MCY0387286.1 EscR/YscR/HrcR family type III secretion system export apparatus protein [Robbsia betulipollinis]